MVVLGGVRVLWWSVWCGGVGLVMRRCCWYDVVLGWRCDGVAGMCSVVVLVL